MVGLDFQGASFPVKTSVVLGEEDAEKQAKLCREGEVVENAVEEIFSLIHKRF